MFTFGANLDYIVKTKKFISSKFDMKDIKESDVILGIKILLCNNVLSLSQSHYVENVLKKCGHFNIKLVSTLYDPNRKLVKNFARCIYQFEYALQKKGL